MGNSSLHTRKESLINSPSFLEFGLNKSKSSLELDSPRVFDRLQLYRLVSSTVAKLSYLMVTTPSYSPYIHGERK